MVTIKVLSERGVEDKKIPQCFADLQWVDYIEAVCADRVNEPVIGVLSALTGIQTDDFELMSIENQSFILNACSFFWDEEPEYIEVSNDIKELSVAQGTWQQLIDCEAEFKRVNDLDKPQIAAAQMIIKTYTKQFAKDGWCTHPGVDLNGMRVPEALGYWSFFFCNSVSGKSDGQACTTMKRTTMRLQQVSKRFRLSDGSQHYTHSQKGMFLNTNRYSIKKPLTSTQPYSLKRLKGSTQKSCSISIQRLTNR